MVKLPTTRARWCKHGRSLSGHCTACEAMSGNHDPQKSRATAIITKCIRGFGEYWTVRFKKEKYDIMFDDRKETEIFARTLTHKVW